MRPITQIVIHCAATPNGDQRFTRDWIDAEHRRGNPAIGRKPFRMIGYHYVIHVDGALHEGRKLEEIGAHVAGSNARSIGICMIGTDRFRLEQWETLRDLVTDLQRRFPTTSVWGHRDYSPDLDGDGLIEPWEHFKLCPGFAVDAWRLSGMDPQWNVAHLFGIDVRNPQ